jgi:2,3-bisphosphoglycerate-independent phosphoglycerate mutase
LQQILIFIDGVGLGASKSKNPFFSCKTPGLDSVLEDRRFVSETAGFCGSKATLAGIDATLGVPGLPQSATGQASIFTGINAAAYLGSHLNGFPNRKLRGLLALKGLFKRFQQNNYRVCFANAYRPQFFDLLADGLPGDYYSCSTLVTYYGGLKFFGLPDLLNGQAIYMDITNNLLNKQDYEMPMITPEEGASRLLKLSRHYDFCLFEYFLSDLAGHLGDEEQIAKVINTLDRFIGTLAMEFNPGDTFIMVSSDHGNLEDTTVSDHTLNSVPLLMIGDPELRRVIGSETENLTDLLRAVETGLFWKG